MSTAGDVLLNDFMARARRARMCPESHPTVHEPCVLRWGHTVPHKTDRCDRWQS